MQVHVLYCLVKSRSEFSCKFSRRLNRLFTRPDRFHTRRANNDSIRKLTNLFGLFGRADTKSHAHRHGRMISHTLNQIAKSV